MYPRKKKANYESTLYWIVPYIDRCFIVLMFPFLVFWWYRTCVTARVSLYTHEVITWYTYGHIWHYAARTHARALIRHFESYKCDSLLKINPFRAGGKHNSHLLLTPTETKGSSIPTVRLCRDLVETTSNKTKIPWHILIVQKRNSSFSGIFEGGFCLC